MGTRRWQLLGIVALAVILVAVVAFVAGREAAVLLFGGLVTFAATTVLEAVRSADAERSKRADWQQQVRIELYDALLEYLWAYNEMELQLHSERMQTVREAGPAPGPPSPLPTEQIERMDSAALRSAKWAKFVVDDPMREAVSMALVVAGGGRSVRTAPIAWQADGSADALNFEMVRNGRKKLDEACQALAADIRAAGVPASRPFDGWWR